MMSFAHWVRLGLTTVALLVLAAVPDARAQAPQGGFVDLPGVKLWVVDTGGPGDAIVLLHPRTGSSKIWENQLSAFAKAGYRVIAPDKPGAGKSSEAPGAKPVPYADTLDRLADHLQLGRFILVGVAEGGYFAFDYAASSPDRVKKLVLGATGLGVQVDAEGRAFRENSAIPGFAKLPPEVRELSPTYRGLNPAGVRRWLEIEHEATPTDAPRPLLRTPNTVEKLATLPMPVLVLAGDVDLTTPSAAIRLWAKHLRNHELKLITEAGHAIMWEQPEAFNQAVLGFVSK